MSSWSATGGSAAEQCGSLSPWWLFPGTPSAARRSTEEIWKDINLSFLKEKGHNRQGNLSEAANFLGGFLGDGSAGLNRGSSPAGPPDPAACLSLYWTPADTSHQVPPHPPKPIQKRGPKHASATDSEDKRRKRLMKNRESADRSRARKQAYTNELEKEVALLRKENARLRSQREQEKMRPSAPSGHHHQMLLPEKTKLHRTLTAPF